MTFFCKEFSVFHSMKYLLCFEKCPAEDTVTQSILKESGNFYLYVIGMTMNKVVTDEILLLFACL